MFKVIIWQNDGQRFEVERDTLTDALTAAKVYRNPENRTVKVGHCGDSIRHWTRSGNAQRNKWVAHSTAECSR